MEDQNVKIMYENDSPLCLECGKPMKDELVYQCCANPICRECEEKTLCKYILWRVLICLIVANVFLVFLGLFLSRL